MARLSTKQERDALARRIKEKSKGFGKTSSEKFARESKARLKGFCDRILK